MVQWKRTLKTTQELTIISRVLVIMLRILQLCVYFLVPGHVSGYHIEEGTIDLFEYSITAEKDAEALHDLQNVFGLRDGPGDPCFPLPWSWLVCDVRSSKVIKIYLSNRSLSSPIPPSFGQLDRLEELWLDNNKLTGHIPEYLGHMKQLRVLHLENNSLTGPLPRNLGIIPVNLQVLAVDDNDIHGTVLQSTHDRAGLLFTFAGNSGLSLEGAGSCSVASDSQILQIAYGSSALVIIATVAGVGGATVIIIALAIILVICCWCPGCYLYNANLSSLQPVRREAPTPALVRLPSALEEGAYANKLETDFWEAGLNLMPRTLTLIASQRRSIASRRSSGSLSEPPLPLSTLPIAREYGNDIQQAEEFSLGDIQALTRSYQTQIGEGPSGRVFHGVLPDGQEVAVKVNDDLSLHVDNLHVKKIIMFSKIEHRHLLPLLGYCDTSYSRFLIYEFAPEGTFRERLRGHKAGKDPISWRIRLNILFGVAEGLERLHFNDPPIAHGNLKSSNIYLDENLVAKLGDFGIFAPYNITPGYIDPEVKSNSKKSSRKSDIYCFGMVLLEAISGTAPEAMTTLADGSQRNLVNSFRIMLKTGNIEAMIDPCLRAPDDDNLDALIMESIWKVFCLSFNCLEHRGENRPSIRQVVKDLHKALNALVMVQRPPPMNLYVAARNEYKM